MLRPLFQRIKVLPDAPPDKTKSGIILTETSKKEKKLTGVVVDVGGSVELLSAGDRIMYGEYAGFPNPEDEEGLAPLSGGITYQYMNESDAIAIFEVSAEKGNE